MPRRRTHLKVGVPVGALAAGILAIEEHPVHALLEIIGGAIGGYAGSRCPDILEPSSLGWNHRGFFHSWTFMTSGLIQAPSSIRKWEQFCRRKANELAKLQEAEAECSLRRFSLYLGEALWRMAAGMLAGFAASYTSHLALDLAFSKARLPVMA